ncbi:hypothetical protein [Mesorhizobium sp. M0187]|uniref:hypothetical protein n=1 Tax=Mesorhizobium sp. M0187 TaxID=2956908 RepID=UPI003337C7C9
MKYRKLAVGLVLAVVVLSGALLLLGGALASLTTSMFGASRMISKSMEPYGVVLRTPFKGGKRLPPEAKPLEWRVVLPRAFVTIEIGTNGAIAPGGRRESRWYEWPARRTFFIDFETVIDLKMDQLTPAVLSDPARLKDNFLNITLSNSSLYPRVKSDEYCIRDDDYDSSIVEDGIADQVHPCSSTPRCGINTIVDGWDVRLIVSRAIYNQPQKMCAAARRFLLEHTIRRDSIR